MRRFSIVLIAAILGSVLTVLIYEIAVRSGQNLKIEHIENVPVRGVAYSVDDEGDLVPLDFTKVSKTVTDAVVHIRSSQKIQARQRQQLPDPFRDFFGEEFYDRFFGPQSPQQRQQQPRRRMGSGSGVIINEKGYVITNNHVVVNADQIQVTLHDNRSYEADVVGTDPTTDLALLKVNETGLSTLPLVNSDNVEVGEWVLAVGNPFNLTSTVTAGIVSAKARSINILREQYAVESFIQTDAAINPGNSGGALVNLQGGLIGINTAIASPTGSYSGYGFAVPSNIVNKVIEDLLKYGEVQRGYLGVTIRNLTAELADQENIDRTEGVYIDSVMSNSAADKAGLRAGDVVVQVDGNEVTKASELQAQIATHRPGDEVNLRVYRNNNMKNLEVELKNREGTVGTVAKVHSELSSKLGAEFSTVSEETAEKLKIDGGVRVVRLYAGKLTRQTQMREGFIITKVNDKQVDSVDEFAEIVKNKKGGVYLEGVYPNVEGTYYYAFGM